MSIQPRPIEIVGHGGAGAFYPGNSRESLLFALQLRVDRIEFNLRVASNRELVLVHDPVLSDATGAKRNLSQIPVSDLRELLPGFLTLDDAFTLLRGKVKILVDVKSPGYETELIETILRHRIESDVNLSCTDPRVIKTMRAAFPEMPIGLSTGHRLTGGALMYGRKMARFCLRRIGPAPFLSTMRWSGADQIMLHRKLATPHTVSRIQQAGFQVYVWTVDHPNEIRQMLACNVDAIISNRPDLVREAIMERNTATGR